VTVTLHLGDEDLLQVRFAISPIWEVVSAVRTLVDERSRRHHAPWVSSARAAAARLDLGVLMALHPRRGYVPDFASPPPKRGTPSLASQLEELRATPAPRVAAELRRCRATHRDASARALLDRLIADPAGARETVAAAIDGVWREVMAPLWPHISGLLERDIAMRSQQLGALGLRRVIETLHPRVHWRGRSASAGAPTHSIVVAGGPGADERRLAGEGLVLMPSAFVWPAVAVIVDPPWQPTIAYPAPGVELLWEPAGGPPQALERLLGRTRALVLAAIERPLSTTAIARRHSLSASSVSSHLAALRDAGLAASTRRGHEVLYRRTPLGDRLLSEARE
jgi:DNA-binding transcriptional ArsR family regulator